MKLDKVFFALGKIKLVRSYRDFNLLLDQLPFLMPRIRGNYMRDTSVPPSLQVEPTNYCNIKCISCSVHRMRRKRGYMEFGLFKKIIDDAARVGVKRVHLYLHGEPLLHPKITQMIAYMKLKGIGVSLITNGMSLDKKKIEEILAANINLADYVTFSILGCSREVHENVMKGVDHEKVVNNVLDFLKIRKEHGMNCPSIETVFYEMPENAHEARQYIEKWKGVVDRVQVVPSISSSFAEYKKEASKNLPLRRKTCKQIWERMTVYWNGDVGLCCEDLDGDYIFGNLAEKTIKEIWNSRELLSIRKLHKEKRFGEISLCQRCDM